MQKPSLFYLLLTIVIVFLSTYEAFFPYPADFVVGRSLGLIAFFLLSITLMIGPLVQFWPKTFAALIETRRSVGLSAFAFMGAHFILVFLTRFGGEFTPILSSLNFAIAVPALLIFGIMALISNDWSIKTLGNPTWKRIQRLTYVGFTLVLGHYYLNAAGLVVTDATQGTFLNLGELLVWIAAGLAIALQAAGFWNTQKKKQAMMGRGTPSASGELESPPSPE